MPDPEHTIAIVYGPVGFVIQEPGKRPHIRMRNQWQHVAEQINDAIEKDMAFCGPDRVVRCMEEEPLDNEHLTTLSAALQETSDGDLYLHQVH